VFQVLNHAHPLIFPVTFVYAFQLLTWKITAFVAVYPTRGISFSFIAFTILYKILEAVVTISRKGTLRLTIFFL